ncbi:hypothetical protein ACQ9BO_26110 [Flavobacterium sp. P21]|uniref:hypothetical protein n=1 Tax=Flavobacterium sp. P21 TaxID=3423948 RepID=UPI003D67F4D5
MIKPLVSFHRIEKMAKYRNIYMEYIKTLSHDIDNVIIIDVDVRSFSVNGVVNSVLKCQDKCGSIFANGVTVKSIMGKIYSKIFYDSFAVYEYPLKEKFGFTDDSLFFTKKNVSNQLRKNKMYPVISAFGGLAVYNYKAIQNLQYNVMLNDFNNNEAICEHIPFNIGIINLGYKNFISSEMQLIYGSHSFGSILKCYLDKRVFDFLFKVSRLFKF